ncbi:hypothetical protein IJE86_02380 [bacterium]|nr:hypothetical protein [bacterium]
MKDYQQFKRAVEQNKEQNYKNLKREVKTVEKAIESFLEKALECTAIMNERDFFVTQP